MFSVLVLKSNAGKIVLLSIPLILSSITHTYNAAQFPSFHPDEGVYIRRSLHLAAGLGLQDPDSKYDHSQDSSSRYDHPYFGPIVLSSIFKILGYPETLNTTADFASIQTLFSVPRVIMGVLSVFDTLLVYLICDRRFGSKIAFFSALLFSVMPLTWYTRYIVLDSIMLPFALTSILLSLEFGSRKKYNQTFVVLSGVCLGLAIFTKIPAFTLIPLIGFLIYQNASRTLLTTNRLKILTIWIIPVISIPAIWPAYAFVSGDLNEWIEGVHWQAAERYSKGKLLSDAISGWLKSDPVLLILGTAGIIYLTARREFIAILWTVPYFLLLLLVGWTTQFHITLAVPLLCISAAKIIYDIPHMLRFKKRKVMISSIMMSSILVFGFLSTIALLSINLSYVQLATASYVSNEIVTRNKNHNASMNYLNTGSATSENPTNKLTVVSSPVFSWIWKYVFNQRNAFSHVRDTQPIKTQDIILVVDSTYRHVISKTEGENETQILRLENLYNSTDIVALFKETPSDYNKKIYPFTGIESAKIGSRTTEVRTNY